MKIIIDADASPVKNEVIQLAEKYQIHVLLISSFAHFSTEIHPKFVQTIYVEHGADSADFKIIQKSKPGDIIITQDYGLASLLLPKKCFILHHLGYEYTKENINQLLQRRHLNALKRKNGNLTKGPKPFTKKEREHFLNFFDTYLKELLHISD